MYDRKIQSPEPATSTGPIAAVEPASRPPRLQRRALKLLAVYLCPEPATLVAKLFTDAYYNEVEVVRPGAIAKAALRKLLY